MSRRDRVEQVFDSCAHHCRFRLVDTGFRGRVRKGDEMSVVLDFEPGGRWRAAQVNVGFWPTASTERGTVDPAAIERVRLVDALEPEAASALRAVLRGRVPNPVPEPDDGHLDRDLVSEILFTVLWDLGEDGTTEAGARRMLERAQTASRPEGAIPVPIEDGRLRVAPIRRPDPVERACTAFGKAHEFRKRGRRWWRIADGVTVGFRLQRSVYGPQYYLEADFALHALLDEDRWKFPAWQHLHWRVTGLLGEREAQRLRELLDLEEQIADDERIAALTVHLERDLLPLVEQGSSIEGLRALTRPGAPMEHAPLSVDVIPLLR